MLLAEIVWQLCGVGANGCAVQTGQPANQRRCGGKQDEHKHVGGPQQACSAKIMRLNGICIFQKGDGIPHKPRHLDCKGHKAHQPLTKVIERNIFGIAVFLVPLVNFLISGGFFCSPIST